MKASAFELKDGIVGSKPFRLQVNVASDFWWP